MFCKMFLTKLLYELICCDSKLWSAKNARITSQLSSCTISELFSYYSSLNF